MDRRRIPITGSRWSAVGHRATCHKQEIRKEMTMTAQSMGQDDHVVTADEERLSQRLREAREYLGMSQEFVAEHLGLSRASVSAIETTKRKVSSLELKKLASLYKSPLSHFLGEDDRGTEAQDETARALFRTTRDLSDLDRQQVLRFAQFLRQAGPAPTPADDRSVSES